MKTITSLLLLSTAFIHACGAVEADDEVISVEATVLDRLLPPASVSPSDAMPLLPNAAFSLAILPQTSATRSKNS